MSQTERERMDKLKRIQSNKRQRAFSLVVFFSTREMVEKPEKWFLNQRNVPAGTFQNSLPSERLLGREGVGYSGKTPQVAMPQALI